MLQTFRNILDEKKIFVQLMNLKQAVAMEIRIGLLLEVQLPRGASCPSVGRLSVCHNFLEWREVSLLCSYLGTCYKPFKQINLSYIWTIDQEIISEHNSLFSAVKSELPLWKLCFNYLCGVDMVDTPEEQQQQHKVPVDQMHIS